MGWRVFYHPIFNRLQKSDDNFKKLYINDDGDAICNRSIPEADGIFAAIQWVLAGDVEIAILLYR